MQVSQLEGVSPVMSVMGDAVVLTFSGVGIGPGDVAKWVTAGSDCSSDGGHSEVVLDGQGQGTFIFEMGAMGLQLCHRFAQS